MIDLQRRHNDWLIRFWEWYQSSGKNCLLWAELTIWFLGNFKHSNKVYKIEISLHIIAFFCRDYMIKMFKLLYIGLLLCGQTLAVVTNVSVATQTTIYRPAPDSTVSGVPQFQSNVLTLAYLIPYTHGYPIGYAVASTVIVSIEEIKKRQLLPGYEVHYIWRDSWCQPLHSVKVTLFGKFNCSLTFKIASSS